MSFWKDKKYFSKKDIQEYRRHVFATWDCEEVNSDIETYYELIENIPDFSIPNDLPNELWGRAAYEMQEKRNAYFSLLKTVRKSIEDHFESKVGSSLLSMKDQSKLMSLMGRDESKKLSDKYDSTDVISIPVKKIRGELK